jgi:hypothetical protein
MRLGLCWSLLAEIGITQGDRAKLTICSKETIKSSVIVLYVLKEAKGLFHLRGDK